MREFIFLFYSNLSLIRSHQRVHVLPHRYTSLQPSHSIPNLRVRPVRKAHASRLVSSIIMDAIRTKLADLSTMLPSQTPTANRISYITVVAPNVLAVLSPSSDPSLYLVSLMPSNRASPASRVKKIALPAQMARATKILPAEGLFAIVAPRGICICDAPSAHNLMLSAHFSLATSLFDSLPHLQVCDAAWSPAAPGFLLVLTSDANLRLYDVVSKRSAAAERMRLTVISASPPVSLAFGRGSRWAALSVYVLAEDGSIYVAAPIAPIGTRLPLKSWQAMRNEVNAVITREQTMISATSNEPDTPASVVKTPRRALDFSKNVEDRNPQAQSWALRQARLQKMFLETVFAVSSTGDMVATREFKPAPLLFQGPLFTEHDDLEEAQDEDDVPYAKYCDLTLLHCGMDRPPVLLRTSNAGEVSVLIGLESVEAQWFLSSDNQVSSATGLLNGSDEYAECARAVAPLLLCFEHLSFDNQAMLFPLGQRTHADVLYVLTSTAIFSVHLSFISAIADAGTLESVPTSSISQVLSVWSPQEQANGSDKSKVVLGLTPWYAKGQGPVAIVLSSDGRLHASDPFRWITELDKSWPQRLLGSELSSDSVWAIERPLTGSRAFACPEYGKEMMELLRVVRDLQGESGGRIAPGTLGTVREITSYSAVVQYLETRLEVIVGGSSSAGIGDSLKALADVLDQWSSDLRARAGRDLTGAASLHTAIVDLERSQNALHRKLMLVEKGNLEMKERTQGMMQRIQNSSSQLSEAESERYRRLKERKRHLMALRNRLMELESKRDSSPNPMDETSPQLPSWSMSSVRSPRSPFTRARVVSPNVSWRGRSSPFAQRRSDWSPRGEGIDLTRDELRQIRSTLLKHSEDIEFATELSDKLWKKLAMV